MPGRVAQVEFALVRKICPRSALFRIPFFQSSHEVAELGTLPDRIEIASEYVVMPREQPSAIDRLLQAFEGKVFLAVQRQ